MRQVIALLIMLCADDATAIQLQEHDSWCWVSSIQDVLYQAGINQSQTEVATRLRGLSVNRPARISEVVTLVNSYGLKALQSKSPDNSIELFNTLASNWRMIAFVRRSNSPLGHFIVLQGFDEHGGIVISDPWTGSTYTQSAQTLYNQWHWTDTIVVGQ